VVIACVLQKSVSNYFLKLYFLCGINSDWKWLYGWNTCVVYLYWSENVLESNVMIVIQAFTNFLEKKALSELLCALSGYGCMAGIIVLYI